MHPKQKQSPQATILNLFVCIDAYDIQRVIIIFYGGRVILYVGIE